MPIHLANAMIVISVMVVMQLAVIGAMILLIFKMYHKPTGDHVLVRTGHQGAKVSVTGGILCYPGIHTLCRVYAGVVLLKHPDTGTDWPVQLVLNEENAIKAMHAFGSKPEQDIKPALQAIADQHRDDPDGLDASLASVGYAPIG